MAQTRCPSRRRILALVAWGAAVLVDPSLAWARDGEDDDSGGRRRGRGRGGDDDRDEDRDDNRNGRRDGEDESDRPDDDHDGVPREPAPDGGSDRLRDVTVLYPDGWTERVLSGRYELRDHMSRLVVARPATAEDVSRMLALR